MVLTKDQRARTEYITTKFLTLQKWVDNLKNYLVNSPNATNANLRLATVTTLFHEYGEFNEELLGMQQDHELVQTFELLAEQYYDVAATVTDLFNRSQATHTPPTAQSTLNTSTFTLTERSDKPRLPELTLISFDGSRPKWPSFKTQFVTYVHNRTDLSDDVKASQLFCHLTGSALAKVAEYDPCAADYENAWKTLLDAYDNKRIVANHHLNALLDLKKVGNKPGEQTLSDLLDAARQHLNILKRIEAKPSDELVVRIIERCLPHNVYSKWNDRLDVDRLPTLELLFKFMQNYVFKQDALVESNNHSQNSRKRSADPVPYQSSKTPKTNVRSFVTTSSSGQTGSSLSCPKCKGEHRLFKCDSFKSLEIQDRWNFAKANKLCFNCLWNHPFPCSSDKHCKECGKKHHTLLHNLKNWQSSKAQGSKSKPSSPPPDASQS